MKINWKKTGLRVLSVVLRIGYPVEWLGRGLSWVGGKMIGWAKALW